MRASSFFKNQNKNNVGLTKLKKRCKLYFYIRISKENKGEFEKFSIVCGPKIAKMKVVIFGSAVRRFSIKKALGHNFLQIPLVKTHLKIPLLIY